MLLLSVEYLKGEGLEFCTQRASFLVKPRFRRHGWYCSFTQAPVGHGNRRRQLDLYTPLFITETVVW